jgi:hypothetical protein
MHEKKPRGNVVSQTLRHVEVFDLYQAAARTRLQTLDPWQPARLAARIRQAVLRPSGTLSPNGSRLHLVNLSNGKSDAPLNGLVQFTR